MLSNGKAFLEPTGYPINMLTGLQVLSQLYNIILPCLMVTSVVVLLLEYQFFGVRRKIRSFIVLLGASPVMFNR